MPKQQGPAQIAATSAQTEAFGGKNKLFIADVAHGRHETNLSK